MPTPFPSALDRFSRLLSWRWLLLLWLLISCASLLTKTTDASAASTETLIGIVGRDFVLLGADSAVSQSIFWTANHVDKIAVIVDPFPQVEAEEATVAPGTKSNTNNNGSGGDGGGGHAILAAVAGDAASGDRLVGYLKAFAAIEEFGHGVGVDVEFVDEEQDSSKASPARGGGLSVKAVAHFARHLIYGQLRTRSPFSVGVLVAGMMREDDDGGNVVVGVVQEDLDDLSSFSNRVRQQVRHATSPFFSNDGGETDREKPELPTAQTQQQQQQQQQGQIGRLRPHLYWLDEYGSLQRMREYGVHGYAGNFLWSVLDQNYQRDMTLEQAHALMMNCFAQLRQRYVISHNAGPPCIKCVDAAGCRLLLPPPASSPSSSSSSSFSTTTEAKSSL